MEYSSRLMDGNKKFSAGVGLGMVGRDDSKVGPGMLRIENSKRVGLGMVGGNE